MSELIRYKTELSNLSATDQAQVLEAFKKYTKDTITIQDGPLLWLIYSTIPEVASLVFSKLKSSGVAYHLAQRIDEPTGSATEDTSHAQA